MRKFLQCRGKSAKTTFTAAVTSASILGLLSACSTIAPLPTADANPPSAAASLQHPRARWVPADWADLPGWNADPLTELWPALLRSCERPTPAWANLCAQARAAALPAFSNDAARSWLQQHLQPYSVQALDGSAEGLATGYFEPLVDASRKPTADKRVPLYAVPPDLPTRKPYWTRQQIDTLPDLQAALRERAIAYVSDPLDAITLQIQGSGRMNITEPDGSKRQVRVAYAAHNDQPYKSLGRWLIDQGELPAAQASMPTIKAWARLHPERLNELLWSNPRVVFFREEPLPDPTVGPKGAQGVPLTPGRSIAVDPQSIPYGTPVWLDTTEPRTSTPLRRAAMAQDTGSAIQGAVRADYFWGTGVDAETQAGRMKQPLRLWVLWPRG